MTRALSQAQTWLPSFPYSFIYSDKVANSTIDEFKKVAPHSNISFVEIKDKSEHIIGSQWGNPWYRAQPRFLPAMHHLWISNPNVRWYIVGDDDTYLYIKNILRRLKKHNSSNPEVVSFFWCTWNQITEYMEPSRDCHPFAQGGSGVLFSKKMMDMVGPHLLKCSEMYNDAEHAAAMRVCVCMERTFGYENWTKGAFIKPWKSGIHPSDPAVVIKQGNTWDAPASFHQVKPAGMFDIKKGHLVMFDDGFVDFAHFAFRSVPVELTRRRWWQLHFGFRIDSLVSHSEIFNAINELSTMDKGKTYSQEYEGNITLIVHCENEMDSDQVDVIDVERGPTTKIHVNLNCPEKQKYYV